MCADLTARNGEGKTTLLNAWYWLLSGRTLNGFTPRRQEATDTDVTRVRLDTFAGIDDIRRDLTVGGTTLYIGGNVVTQTEFTGMLFEMGVDIGLCLLCADANRLVSDSLTSDDLRSLLTKAGVMDGGETDALRKKLKVERDALKRAQAYALTNVSVPPRMCAEPTEAEWTYLERYDECARIVERGSGDVCDKCGQTLPSMEAAIRRKEYNDALTVVQSDTGEYARIQELIRAYDAESVSIRDAERLINAAADARRDVVRIEAGVRELEEAIREAEANAVRADLPDGVTLVTESVSKGGTAKGVCTLCYKGLPLKTVNRAKRVEICVAILDGARRRAGMTDVIPIWLDNAESVQGLKDVHNLIRLAVISEDRV